MKENQEKEKIEVTTSKQFVPVKKSIEEKLLKSFERINKLEEDLDKTLMEVFNDLPDKEIESFDKPITLRIWRGSFMKHTKCETKFRYNNKLYYLCEYWISPVRACFYIEEEAVLKKINPILR